MWDIGQEMFPFYSLHILGDTFNGFIDEPIHGWTLMVPDLGADPQSREGLSELFSAFEKNLTGTIYFL